MLWQRLSQYEHPSDITSSSLSMATPDLTTLRELVCSIVCEELRQVQAVFPQPHMTALSGVIHEEVRQLVQPLVVSPATTPLLSYAEALRASSYASSGLSVLSIHAMDDTVL